MEIMRLIQFHEEMDSQGIADDFEALSKLLDYSQSCVQNKPTNQTKGIIPQGQDFVME